MDPRMAHISGYQGIWIINITKPTWHHMDFLYALTVAKDINKPIMQIFEKYEKNIPPVMEK
ncbi:uncharacterized protein Dana_GF27555 [Drosophila ananassae]|uniref:Uncharacterized protein n=1 Tax=Drosophila ananassae TaxID=7217 RepID=A0A0P9APK6_DROAN|nr:uncharacterized protein Dana_GF27555 [Drosophila ananassae]